MKKISILALMGVLIAALGFVLVSNFSQDTEADMNGQSTPSVTVIPGGSITVTPTGMSYGSRAAGVNIPYNEGGGHYVGLEVNTNTTTWDVKCSRNQNLTSGSYSIPSSNFIYTSVYVSGSPADADVYTNQEFGTVGSPSNVTDTPSTPAAADTLRVDVRYDLTIPPIQAAASNYQATHTYTLTAS